MPFYSILLHVIDLHVDIRLRFGHRSSRGTLRGRGLPAAGSFAGLRAATIAACSVRRLLGRR